ncbi:hypothetical protein ACG2F4_17125 [Halalkalibaculum sp. DA3122]|uniref:hypothetical protein n=1 Tax=unclassified Halalkalibaculum TaxID=2964617 RepID=UPI0037546829
MEHTDISGKKNRAAVRYLLCDGGTRTITRAQRRQVPNEPCREMVKREEAEKQGASAAFQAQQEDKSDYQTERGFFERHTGDPE